MSHKKKPFTSRRYSVMIVPQTQNKIFRFRFRGWEVLFAAGFILVLILYAVTSTLLWRKASDNQTITYHQVEVVSNAAIAATSQAITSEDISQIQELVNQNTTMIKELITRENELRKKLGMQEISESEILASIDQYVQSNIGDTSSMSSEQMTYKTALLAVTYEKDVIANSQNDLTQLSAKTDELMSKPDGFPVETMVTPVYSYGKKHKGYGLQVIGGIKIIACGDGKVVSVEKDGKNKKVTIEHAGGYRTIYTKLGKVYVKKGQIVKRQQKLGKITGTKSKVFELRMTYKGKYIDPESLLMIAG